MELFVGIALWNCSFGNFSLECSLELLLGTVFVNCSGELLCGSEISVGTASCEKADNRSWTGSDGNLFSVGLMKLAQVHVSFQATP